MTENVKDIYRNDSEGVCGVVVIDNNRAKAIPLQPGDCIPLSKEERIATANAPKREADNPFTNGTLVLDTPASEIENRRPIDAPEAEPQSEAPAEEAEKAEAPEEAPAPPPAEDVEATEKAKAAAEATPAPTPGQQKAEKEAARRAEAAKQAAQPGKPVDHEGKPKTPPAKPVAAQ